MKVFEKARTRLLVISNDIKVRDNLVMLLTGYGYFVDYVSDRDEGIASFKKNRQAVVIIDVPSLPRYPERMMRLFQSHKKNPIILIAAGHKDEKLAYLFLKKGVYDVLHLPLEMDYVEVVLKRLVCHSELLAKAEFVQTLVVMTLLVMPAWVLCAFLVAQVFRY